MRFRAGFVGMRDQKSYIPPVKVCVYSAVFIVFSHKLVSCSLVQLCGGRLWVKSLLPKAKNFKLGTGSTV